MSDNKFTNVKIVSVSGELHQFSDIRDLKINVENGLLDVQFDDGSFVFLLDGLRYFEVGLNPHQQGRDILFQLCEVRLTSLEEKNSEIISISDVINCEWKADQGLFMVFGEIKTFGFHLDHVVSYDLKNIK